MNVQSLILVVGSFLSNSYRLCSNDDQGYVNNDDQFTRKTAIAQDQFLDLANWCSQSLGTISILSFANKLVALQWEDQHFNHSRNLIADL